ncbi:MAG: iron-containing alcohol dehydrogenase [Burkholderiales bacterium]
MECFEFHNTKSLVVERGASTTELVERVRALGCSAAFIVTDAGVLKAGLLEKTLHRFLAVNLPFALFHEVQADPPEDVINTAVEAAREFGADCIIGFGGGSSMDVAKLVALLALGKERLSDIYGVNQVKGGRLPLILVPTTAGTGSEVTPISIVTTGVGEKKGVVSPALLPDIAILDAELTLGLPANVTAATGIDAMVHAIEAYTSRRLKNPMSDCLAREALRLLSGSIHQACREGGDIQARENMLLGACMAGMAFANAPVAGVHALAYPVGARFHVPHGLSNSLVLAPVMRFNLPAAASLYAELAEILVPAARGTQEQRADRFVKYLENLAGDLGLETRLRDVGITEQDIPQLADDAMKQTRLLVNNPRDITREDAAALYSEAL